MNFLIEDNSSLHLQDKFNSHIGIDKLIEPERTIDLNSFRNSFFFLKYVVLKEFPLNDIVKLNQVAHKRELDAILCEIFANTCVLFEGPVKILKKCK